MQPKIEIKLTKVDAGIKWDKVEGEDQGAAQKLSKSRVLDYILEKLRRKTSFAIS